MDSGYYAAMTGLIARTQALDTAAANLANTQTPGYRAQREYFRAVLLGPGAGDSQIGSTVNNYGLLGGDRLDLAQGQLQQTGSALDLAIEGQGFFQIQTSNGLRYTRDGAFHRARNGQLVTGAGEAVLSASGKTITVPPGEVTIGGDGALSVDGGVVATIGVFTFPQGTQLKAEGANRYLAPDDAKPVVAKDAALHQGAIETANEDVIQGTVELVLMQRQAEMMQRALTIFHTEFNKIASEDLPRI